MSHPATARLLRFRRCSRCSKQARSLTIYSPAKAQRSKGRRERSLSLRLSLRLCAFAGETFPGFKVLPKILCTSDLVPLLWRHKDLHCTSPEICVKLLHHLL